MGDKPIYVVKPSLPPLEELTPYLEKIWETGILSNNGPFHQQLEERLCERLGVPEIALFNNGTNALLTALQVMDLKGEVITTPYTFVATAHALMWNNLKPVFVDVDPDTLNIDPSKIESAITPETSAILAVHCYGHPCDVAAIKTIADKHNLKVIYDAAHAFDVCYEDSSILNHGDISILSFHATKVFNTFEGGAIICRDAETKSRINRLKNFGIVDEVNIDEVGINGKMAEINAAFGLVQLNHLDGELEKRKAVVERYRELLGPIENIEIIMPLEGEHENYAYFPILVGQGYPMKRDKLFEKMKTANIFARRYFYPLVSDLPMYKGLQSASPQNLPMAKDAAGRVICLPLYADLSLDDVEIVANTIRVIPTFDPKS